jgi:hypothetical protein
VVVAVDAEAEGAARKWLGEMIKTAKNRTEAAELLLQAWWRLAENKPFNETLPDEAARRTGWRAAAQGKEIEIGWLARQSSRPARYQAPTAAELGL